MNMKPPEVKGDAEATAKMYALLLKTSTPKLELIQDSMNFLMKKMKLTEDQAKKALGVV